MGNHASQQGNIESAIPKFQQALEYTESNEDKAFVCTELAVLHQMNRNYPEAEDWFRKAEKADSSNNHLYMAWAEYHDELGDYFTAQAKIGGALARMGTGRDRDPSYQELMLRHNYYEKKIKDPTYRKSLEQFKKDRGLPKLSAPPGWEDGSKRLPYEIDWDTLVETYVGAVVEGEINNIANMASNRV